jgi:hypothetical protein
MSAPRFVDLETLAGHKFTVDPKSVVDIQQDPSGRTVARITRMERDQTGYLVVLKGGAEDVRKLLAGDG